MNRLLKLVLVFFVVAFGLYGCANPPRPVKVRLYHYKLSKTLPGWLKPYKVNGKTYYPMPVAKGFREVCIASWYGPNFHGRLTASGEVYNMYDFTAAHKTLPLGTYVLVKNLENGREVVVRINDRGPFVKNRCLDLSYAAARALGMIKKGTARVEIIVLSPGKKTDHEITYENFPDVNYGKFYFQVGAFEDLEHAEELRAKLVKKFRTVEIEPFYKRGKLFYRVQIYLGENYLVALKRVKLLKKQGFKNGFLIAK